MRRFALTVALGLGLLDPLSPLPTVRGAEPAADGAFISEALKREILGPKQTTVEAQVYAASKVPVLPPVKSAAEWRAYAEGLRARILDEIVFRGEAKKWRDAESRVEWLDSLAGDGYRVRKFRFEAAPDFWIPALLYEPDRIAGKVPVVLNLNGHEGEGKATPYIQERCINLVKRGMLAVNPEWTGKGELSAPGYSHTRMNQLDLVGTSGLSIFYLTMRNALTHALRHPNADASRVAVTGLSGGGWQTIMLSALDTRVKLAVPVAGYSSFATRAAWPELDLGDSEQTPSDLGTIADYVHLTALLAPRPSLLINNARDNCCFRADYAVAPLIREAMPVFRLMGAPDRLRYHLNFDAGHNYGSDNREALYRMLKEFFYPKDENFSVVEMPVAGEVRPAAQLKVDLPAGSLDLHRLALKLSEGLPRKSAMANRRAELAETVRSRSYKVAGSLAGETKREGLTVRNWRLSMDGVWTVPAVEFAPENGRGTVVVAADGGRVEAGEAVKALVESGKRVVAIDPLHYGESKFASRDYLYALLLATVGERLVGIQASQIAAVARWAGGAEVHTFGPRTSLCGRIAGALEPKSVSGVKTKEGLPSLRSVLDGDLTVDKFPEYFCFGLLEKFEAGDLESGR
jgi:dienelactone hydrolase